MTLADRCPVCHFGTRFVAATRGWQMCASCGGFSPARPSAPPVEAEPVGDDPESGAGEEHEIVPAGEDETPLHSVLPLASPAESPPAQPEPTGGELLDLEVMTAVAELFEAEGEGVQYSAAAIASQLGRRATAVRKALRALVDAGVVRAEGSTSDRRYAKTSGGTEAKGAEREPRFTGSSL